MNSAVPESYTATAIITMFLQWRKNVQEENILFWVLFYEIKVVKNNLMLP